MKKNINNNISPRHHGQVNKMKNCKVIRELSTGKCLVVREDEMSNCSRDGSSTDYSLENENSTCEQDLLCAVEKEFGVSMCDLYLAGPDNEICSDEIDDVRMEKIRAFAKAWLQRNEWHDSALYWNYFDGSNWQSVLLHSEDPDIDDNKEYELLDTES